MQLSKKTSKIGLLSLLSLVSLFLVSCFGGEDSTPKIVKRIHVLNPWMNDVGGSRISIHGESVIVDGKTWQSILMEQTDACGWFVFEVNTSDFGDFRFLKAKTWDVSFGRLGLGSESPFNLDFLFKENDDLYIYIPDGETKPGRAQNTKPVVAGCEGGQTIEIPEAGTALKAFPQQATYNFGIKPQFHKWNDVQNIYQGWRSSFVESDGELTRVKFDDPDYTVSEGIAYGMLISVYMDNALNNTRADFDGMWAYYKKFRNASGVMDWKVDGFSTVVATGGASDAELDAAVALLMAHKQWGEDSYLADALELISIIKEHEVTPEGILLPGDQWNTLNPSYYSWAGFELFAAVDPANADFWLNVRDKQYSLAQSAAHSSTGLIPNWIDETGAADDPGTGYAYPENFGFDAVRIPWRAAWAYTWYGHSEAQAIASKIGHWSLSKTEGNPAAIRDGYTLSGAVETGRDGYEAGPAFTGAFATASMTDAELQGYLDATYAQLSIQTGDYPYYQVTLQVLYTLLLTGNMPNYYQ